MYIEILGLDINNISKYTKDDIKGIYKKIALECHPDKLIKTQDIKVKNAKIERFKKACIAYKKAIEDFDNYGELRAYPNSTDNNRGDFGDYGDYGDFGDFGDFGPAAAASAAAAAAATAFSLLVYSACISLYSFKC